MNNKMPVRITSFIEKKLRGLRSRYWWLTHKSLFPVCGNNVRIQLPTNLICRNIYLGNDISIGPGAIFWAVHSKIVIGDKVVFGPEVVVMGGDHDISKIGRFIIDITEDEKDKCNDQDVIFEDDIWVGARALILKGVIVGRGAVIGAGALVNQNVPPYSIMVGVPARPVRLRWTIQEILQHENILYPKHKRLSEAYLENIIKETLQLIDYSK